MPCHTISLLPFADMEDGNTGMPKKKHFWLGKSVSKTYVSFVAMQTFLCTGANDNHIKVSLSATKFTYYIAMYITIQGEKVINVTQGKYAQGDVIKGYIT